MTSPPALVRTLYRELLRTANALQRVTGAHAAPVVASSLSQMELRSATSKTLVSKESGRNPGPTSLVRQAFRADSAPAALDDAFAALRVGNETLAWLQVNDTLHQMRHSRAEVVDGACVIADVLDAAPAPSSCSEHVAAELDRIADAVRALGAGDDAAASHAGRLRTVQRINSVLFEQLGFVGDYADIVSYSSISDALAKRRGIPITMCVLYAAVATRLGLNVAVTNLCVPRQLCTRALQLHCAAHPAHTR
jgi:hypothetical protein